MINKKKMLIIMICILSSVLLSACERKQIFVKKEDAYKLKALRDTELENDNYYVKDKSQFYLCYKPQGTATGITSQPKSSRLLWFNKEETLIPSYYKGELIAYQSNELKLSSVTLERFENIGYSIGMHGGEMNVRTNGINYQTRKIIKETSAEKEFKKSKSNEISIVEIDGNAVTEDFIDSAGVIRNMEKNQTYEIGYYEGTKYKTTEITADICYLKSFEVFTINEISTTKNGYLCIQIPFNLKSGYYYINGVGLFKYYDFEKGEKDIHGVDMNEAYYKTDLERLLAYSQQYVVDIAQKSRNAKFTVEYEIDDSIEQEDIKGVLTGPDGTMYDFENSGLRTMDIELDTAMAGTWQINIMPKTLKIKSVTADASDPSENAIEDKYTFFIEEPLQNIQFTATYSGKWENAKKQSDDAIWGVVENANNESVNMVVDEKNKKLTASYPYLPAGTYTVTIYHYYGIEIEDVTYGQDEGKFEEIIITTG